MSIEAQLEGVEISIEEARAKIEKSKALRRLEKNKDYQLIFLDGLLKEDAINQVQLLAAPGLKVPGEGPKTARAGVMARIEMIGELCNFLRWTHLEADQAEAALDSHEEARDELLAEQLRD